MIGLLTLIVLLEIYLDRDNQPEMVYIVAVYVESNPLILSFCSQTRNLLI